MFSELRIPAHLAARPSSFAALMELYERNYIALRRLCPALDELEGVTVSSADGAAALHLRLLERTRYTTTVELSQRIGDAGRTPTLPVRVYRDARQAEVLVSGVHPEGLNCDPVADGGQRDLALCWQANLFLHEWLSHCLGQGHRFGETPVSA
ncbi:DUF1249 domain-containing protein [Acidihalobacter prosperus]